MFTSNPRGSEAANPDPNATARNTVAKEGAALGRGAGRTAAEFRLIPGRGPVVLNPAAQDPQVGLGAPFSPLPRSRSHDVTERRVLVVGRGISVQGTVQDAERLLIEGCMEASTIRATELSIAHGGLFKGEVEVKDAEIFGTIEGMLTARGILVVRDTGRVLGTAHCHRLQVDDGGQITAQIEMIAD